MQHCIEWCAMVYRGVAWCSQQFDSIWTFVNTLTTSHYSRTKGFEWHNIVLTSHRFSVFILGCRMTAHGSVWAKLLVSTLNRISMTTNDLPKQNAAKRCDMIQPKCPCAVACAYHKHPRHQNNSPSQYLRIKMFKNPRSILDDFGIFQSRNQSWKKSSSLVYLSFCWFPDMLKIGTWWSWWEYDRKI